MNHQYSNYSQGWKDVQLPVQVFLTNVDGAQKQVSLFKTIRQIFLAFAVFVLITMGLKQIENSLLQKSYNLSGFPSVKAVEAVESVKNNILYENFEQGYIRCNNSFGVDKINFETEKQLDKIKKWKNLG